MEPFLAAMALAYWVQLRNFNEAIMDNQQLFNLVVSVAGFLAIYVINNLTRQIQNLENEIKTPSYLKIERKWHQNYMKLYLK